MSKNPFLHPININDKIRCVSFSWWRNVAYCWSWDEIFMEYYKLRRKGAAAVQLVLNSPVCQQNVTLWRRRIYYLSTLLIQVIQAYLMFAWGKWLTRVGFSTGYVHVYPFWTRSALSVWALLSQPSTLLLGEELREVHTWISNAFISGSRVVAMVLDIHGFPWGNVFSFLQKKTQMLDLLGQKNELKEKLSVWSLPGYLKETKATESHPFIVKQTQTSFAAQ